MFRIITCGTNWPIATVFEDDKCIATLVATDLGDDDYEEFCKLSEEIKIAYIDAVLSGNVESPNWSENYNSKPDCWHDLPYNSNIVRMAKESMDAILACRIKKAIKKELSTLSITKLKKILDIINQE